MPTRKNMKGHLSLLIMTTSFLALYIYTRKSVDISWQMKVLMGGIEGGTTGSFADWFATEALFRKIPPFSKHTDIIRHKRRDLTEAIADLVQYQWLSPVAIREKLEEVKASSILLAQLEQPETREKLLDILRKEMSYIACGLDSPETGDFLERMLRHQIQNLDIAAPLGHWIEDAIDNGEHDAVWDALLDALHKYINSEESHRTIEPILKSALKKYLPVILNQVENPELADYIERCIKDKLNAVDIGCILGDWMVDASHTGRLDEFIESIMDEVIGKIKTGGINRKITTIIQSILQEYQKQHEIKGWFAEKLIDKDDAARQLVNYIASSLEEARHNRDNPIRIKLDAFILETGENLLDCEPGTTRAAKKLKDSIVNNADWHSLVTNLLTWSKDKISSELTSDNPTLRLIDYEKLTEVVVSAMAGIVDEARGNSEHPVRRKLTQVFREFAHSLAVGDPKATALLDGFKNGILANADIRRFIDSLTGSFKKEILRQLERNDTPLMCFAVTHVDYYIAKLRDEETRVRLDGWVRTFLSELAERHHDEIGKIVRQSFDKLSDDQLVEQVKENTWNDLQSIRVNGAVVGFMVGAVIALVQMI